MVLGVPPVDGVLVVLVQQQPLLLLAPLLTGPRRTSTSRPRSFSPKTSACSSPDSTAAAGSSVACGSQVPMSQTITSPPPYSPAGITPSKSRYSTGWSSTCTAIRRTAGSSVGPARHRPRHQHAVDLEAQVVVQAPGPVPLHDEARPVARGRHSTTAAPDGSGVRAKSRIPR